MQFLVSPAIYNSVVRPASAAIPLLDQIALDCNFYPYFTACVGTIDGTHISVSPNSSEKSLSCNCKGWYLQSVLTLCNFGIYFTNVVFSWEGPVADSYL